MHATLVPPSELRAIFDEDADLYDRAQPSQSALDLVGSEIRRWRRQPGATAQQLDSDAFRITQHRASGRCRDAHKRFADSCGVKRTGSVCRVEVQTKVECGRGMGERSDGEEVHTGLRHRPRLLETKTAAGFGQHASGQPDEGHRVAHF